jgi:hypothetical protein
VTLPVKEAGEPIAKILASPEAAGNAVPLDPPGECGPRVNLVKQPIPFGDAIGRGAGQSSHVPIVATGHEEIRLLVPTGRTHPLAKHFIHKQEILRRLCPKIIAIGQFRHKTKANHAISRLARAAGPQLLLALLAAAGWAAFRIF